MNKIIFTALTAFLFPMFSIYGQDVWTVDRCMDYSARHNARVMEKETEMENSKADRLAAIGNFLPTIEASGSVRYSFGRSVNPETNTFKDISTFNNNYNLYASLPLFRGGELINSLKLSKVSLIRGKASLQEERDMAALETFRAFIENLYYKRTSRIAKEKLAETDSLLYKAMRMEDLGMKAASDIAEMEAQKAADDHTVAEQENRYEVSVLRLKRIMNLPINAHIVPDEQILDSCRLSNMLLMDTVVTEDQLAANPIMIEALSNVEIKKYRQRMAWGQLFPTISLNAGTYTSYFKELGKTYPAFKDQLSNNLGYYFGFNLSIPLLSGFRKIGAIKQAKNNYKLAQIEYSSKKNELVKIVTQAILDRRAALKEALQAEKMVEKEELAYHTVKRKYEEGLMTSLDLRNASYNLMKSRVDLIQKKLNFILQERLVRYYQGYPLFEVQKENHTK